MGFYSRRIIPIVLAGIIGTTFVSRDTLPQELEQISQSCDEVHREPLDLFFRRMGNQEEITVYWPEVSYENTLGPQIITALGEVNQYIEDNNLDIGRLVPSTDENSDIRIRNIETYIHDAISDGVIDNIERLFPYLISYSYVGLTVIEDQNNITNNHTDDELCDPDHIMILLANYRPVESTGHQLFEEINSLIGEKPEENRYFALGTSGGDIICVNSSRLNNYPGCNEEDHNLRYTALIEHELLHALGIRGHDVGFGFDETTESGIIGMNLMSIRIVITLTNGFGEESGSLIVPEFSNFETNYLIEIHGVRE